MTARELSVVIPTCGRAELLRQTVTSLLRQTAELSRVEILVAVDGADPDTLALVRELAPCAPCPLIALPQPRRGQGAARNAGIAHASGRVVLMLDDDITASRHLFAEHLRHHAGRTDVVVTGALPVERVPNEPAHHRVLRRWWDEEIVELASPTHRASFRDFVTGNVSVARERLLAVGGFDPAFTGYGREDYELGYRLLRAGLHFVFEPKAVGLHRYRKPLLQWLRQFEPMGRADVIFARKHPEIAGDIMNLSPFPLMRWNTRVVTLAEEIVELLNPSGGIAWKKTAALVHAAYYWRGVRETVRDRSELGELLHARLAARTDTGRIGLRGELFVKRAQWSIP
jgi:glycosyltransferase involved in cell wall biosynthesis